MGALALAPVDWVDEVTRKGEPREQDIAAMAVDGEIVMIDTSDYKLDGSVLAVVCRWDGSIGIEYPKTADGRFWAGERSGMHPVKPPPGVVGKSLGCVILGRIISRV